MDVENKKTAKKNLVKYIFIIEIQSNENRI